MFHAYEASKVALLELGPFLKRIERRDRDLARQLRRAGASVHLNVAEGNGLTGGNRRIRFRTAVGSAREVIACAEVAVAFTYVGEPTCRTLVQAYDRVIRLLWRLG